MTASQKTIELAGKIYKFKSENGISIKRLMGLFHASSYEVEDALAYLVESGYMAKGWEVSGWKYSKHKQNRPRQEKPQQDTLFDLGEDHKRTRRSKVIELEVPARSSPIEILRGPIMAGYLSSGWTIGKWRPVKDQVERTDGKSRLLITLWREDASGKEKAEEAKAE